MYFKGVNQRDNPCIIVTHNCHTPCFLSTLTNGNIPPQVTPGRCASWISRRTTRMTTGWRTRQSTRCAWRSRTGARSLSSRDTADHTSRGACRASGGICTKTAQWRPRRSPRLTRVHLRSRSRAATSALGRCGTPSNHPPRVGRLARPWRTIAAECP